MFSLCFGVGGLFFVQRCARSRTGKTSFLRPRTTGLTIVIFRAAISKQTVFPVVICYLYRVIFYKTMSAIVLVGVATLIKRCENLINIIQPKTIRIYEIISLRTFLVLQRIFFFFQTHYSVCVLFSITYK